MTARESMLPLRETPEGKTAYDLVMEARPALSIPPADCTNACYDGLCDCSGESRVRGWAVDIPALRVLLAPQVDEC